MSDRKLEYPDDFDQALTSPELADEQVREARKDDAEKISVEAELQVHQLGSAFWSNAQNWGRERGLISPMENGILETCAAVPAKMPSEKQCAIAMDVLKKLRDEGFPER